MTRNGVTLRSKKFPVHTWKFLFTNRVIEWNDLLSFVINAKTIDSLKKKPDDYF